MTILIIPNLGNPNAAAAVDRAVSVLCTCGAEVLLPDTGEMRQKFSGLSVRFAPECESFHLCDAVVTVGGDGTILHAARTSLEYGVQKPLLGINVGRLGFLATVEADEIEKLARLVYRDFSLDKRSMLSVSVEGSPESEQIALNDVMITKNSPTQTVDIEVYCDGIPVNKFRGDGVVVATPTGSTAYSLSAGGPVLDAHIEGLVVTPICAHGLHSPPMVLSAGRRLRIRASSSYQAPAPLLSCDGDKPHEVPEKRDIEIAFSENTFDLICFNQADQFDAIGKKLAKL